MDEQRPGEQSADETVADTPRVNATRDASDTVSRASHAGAADAPEGGAARAANEPAVPRGPDPAENDPSTPPSVSNEPDRKHEHPTRLPGARISLPPTLTLLLGLAAAIIIIAGLKQVASIVAPTFLALTLIIAFYPVYKLMRKILPGAIAGLLLIVILYGIIAALGGSIAIAATSFATEIGRTEYTSTFTGLIADARTLLAQKGIDSEEIDHAISNFDLRNLTGVAKSLANTVTGLTTTMLFLLTVMIFLVMDAGGFGARLKGIHRLKPHVADALVDFGRRVRRYWLVSTIFGLIVAVIDYAALVWLGVPLATTFALLSFVTNYIPNIGFVLGLIPPAFLALLSGGVSTMIWVIAIYSVANFFIQTILQPKFTGDAVGINASTAFLSLMIWTYVFGALGALLAIPITLLVKSMLIDRDPNARWVNQFIASQPHVAASTHPL